MCLTEPQAGSDVGALRTRAVRDGDRYRIFGTKIFITYGEHDLAENIVHLVLARLHGAPAGTAGISLFIVPKFLPDADGRPGRRNDLRCVSIERKLGLHGSPTCVIAYGDGEGAIGFLLGEENRGMRCMFTMMNNARLAVGHQGLGIAERAYQQALAYAHGRIQGSRAGTPVPIVEHPDVRRMLLTMRAQIAAMRALAYWTAGVPRSQRAPSRRRRATALAGERVAFLTPLVKAWLTDLGYEIASQAVLVHGGVGYIEETGAAQHLRDARILAIYEGTNGIQAMDLVGRKLDMAGGALPWRLIAELRAELPTLPAALAPPLAEAVDVLERTTRHLQGSEPDDRAAGAAAYLRLFATTLGGFLLARGAQAAATNEGGSDWPGLAEILRPGTAAARAGVGAADPGRRWAARSRVAGRAEHLVPEVGGVLHLAAALQLAGDQPAEQCPTRTQGPAGQHVRRPVDAEIEPRQPNQQREDHRQGQEIDLEPAMRLEAGQKGAEGQVGGGGAGGVPAGEARRVDRSPVGEQVGARALDASLDDEAQHHGTDDRDDHEQRRAALAGEEQETCRTERDDGDHHRAAEGRDVAHRRLQPHRAERVAWIGRVAE